MLSTSHSGTPLAWEHDGNCTKELWPNGGNQIKSRRRNQHIIVVKGCKNGMYFNMFQSKRYKNAANGGSARMRGTPPAGMVIIHRKITKMTQNKPPIKWGRQEFGNSVQKNGLFAVCQPPGTACLIPPLRRQQRRRRHAPRNGFGGLLGTFAKKVLFRTSCLDNCEQSAHDHQGVILEGPYI